MSITIPAKLELDAFELDVPEDDTEGHIAALEEITLKEAEPRIEGFGLLSHEKFEEFDVDESTSSYDDHVMQNNIRLSQLLMDVDMDIESFLRDSSLDVTPQPEFQVDSFGTSKRGVITSNLKLISTPTMREHPQFSKRKKIVLDHKRLVLSNEVLKENIRNASDLVSNRRKSHRTVHTMQRESLIASLPNRFYEPLHPCSSKLQLLFSKKEMKIPDSLQIVETLGKLDLSESQIVGSLEPIASILPTPYHCPNVSGSQASRILEHIVPSSTNESIEIEQSSERNEVLSLTDEEINSSATENSELCGWSGCTRKVASYLHQSFLHPKEQREEDVVNFSQVFRGKAPKESARLFYEILVLKSTGFVDVEQTEAYGDIAISKLPKLDQSF
ncbi:uncharacterized protein LOC109818301 [Cajanus cajan]|uniref:uncharacterized protein LOC109818301 n=1 Tax=Cajanus cajan TaxID=3821 RepID=UPI0010FB2E14|nr:uncharacterized protein LOC109818301 [Cajanus cajan]